jgi:hypothetical protein
MPVQKRRQEMIPMTNPYQAFRPLAVPVLLVALAAFALLACFADEAAAADGAALSSSPRISDIYSSIESADVTVEGDAAGMTVWLDLISDGERIASQEISLDGPGTWVAVWPKFEAEKGNYDVCAGLYRSRSEINGSEARSSPDGSVVSRRCYDFFYGGVQPIRFDVRDFRADSRGMHLAISASDPTVVDIYYMLMQGERVMYVNREKAVAIAGSYSMPLIRDYDWKQILEDGQDYSGRVKIVELNHNQTRAFMNSFTAAEDALITETYQDETGASATVLGDSRVPFEGSLRFILSQNGTPVNVTEKKTPILLSGDDETVEISWNETLPAGVYQLRTLLLGRDRSIMDLEENVIEAEPIVRADASVEGEKSPFPGVAAALVPLMIALLIAKRRR